MFGSSVGWVSGCGESVVWVGLQAAMTFDDGGEGEEQKQIELPSAEEDSEEKLREFAQDLSRVSLAVMAMLASWCASS